MALDRKDLISLAKATAKASMNPNASFAFGEKNLTYEALDETFREQMQELAGTYALYRANQNLIFELMEVMMDEVLPKRVLQEYGQFAEVQNFAQGDRPVFIERISLASKMRAKKFVTKVGLAGRYEVFKLDGRSVEVPTSAWGGAAQIGFEEFLDGRVQMSDVYDIVLEGLDEAVYREIVKGLAAVVASMTINKATEGSFVEASMDRLLAIADAYGKSTIYCTMEFAATMVPASGWVSDEMRNTRWNNGYLGNYKGHNVIVLQNSFEDTTNTTKVIDPKVAYIIPTGAEKPVKVAFEGQSAVREVENEDWSREIQTYRKFGVAVVGLNAGICAYINSSLS